MRLAQLSRRPLHISTGPQFTTLVLDEFTDADGTALSAHTMAPTNIPAASWVQFGPDAHTIQSNKAQRGNGTSLSGYVLDAGQPVGKVRATMTDAGQFGFAEVGIIIRYQDINNFFTAERTLSSGVYSVKLYERAASSVTERASIVDSDTTVPKWVEIEDNGVQLTIRNQDGNSASYVTSLFAAETKCGIGRAGNIAFSGISTWDDFTVSAR